MKKILLLSLLLLAGCQKAFLGEEPSSDPVEVFETLWQDFDAHYSLFGVRGVDWDSLYRVYRPQVSSGMGQDRLWDVLCALLAHTGDAHVGLFGPGRYFNASPFYLKYPPDWFDFELIEKLYCGPLTEINDCLHWGVIAGRDVGYIHIGSFLMEDYPIGDLDRLVEAVAACRAVIVDVRDNHGGHSAYAWRLSSWFADNTRNVHFSQVRNGPSHDDFAAPVAHPNFQRPGNLAGRPVVLLTNRRSISGAEWFTLSMKTFAEVTHIGDTTCGSYSSRSMNRFLPNGWEYNYSIEKLTLPDGTSPEGVGCIPQLFVRNDSERWIDEKTIKTALEYLKSRYGI